MEDSIHFSIIIPAKNEEKFIGRCLEGIDALNFDRNHFEVIVVDNGSTDDTKHISQKYGVIVVELEKGNIGELRNRGAEIAKGKILAFLDADCIPYTDWLKNALPHFEKQDVAAVGAKPDVPKSNTTWVERTWASMKRIPSVCNVGWLSTCNLIVRKSAFDAVTGFDVTLTSCEDADIGFRLSRQWRLINDPAVRVVHLREPKTIAEFFRKEHWHGAENYRGMFRHGLTIKEIPSLVLPLVTAVGFLIMGYGIFKPSWGVVLFSMGVILLPAVLQTFKVLARKKKISNIGPVFCLFFVYSLARFTSLIKH